MIPLEDQDLPQEDKLDDLYATVQELEEKHRCLFEQVQALASEFDRRIRELEK